MTMRSIFPFSKTLPNPISTAFSTIFFDSENCSFCCKKSQKIFSNFGSHISFASLDKKPDREELIDLGILVSLSYVIGRREPINLSLHAKEKVDYTSLAHSVYFSYTTFRTCLQASQLSNGEYPLEKVAWRAFKIGLLKELVFDAGWGTGPSILDAAADAVGVYAGYKGAEFFLDKGVFISVSPKGMIKASLSF